MQLSAGTSCAASVQGPIVLLSRGNFHEAMMGSILGDEAGAAPLWRLSV